MRGLNAGDPFRRLVARTLAQQFASEFRQATAPYNFGMASHSGIESVIHYLRAITDTDPNACITKIDGVGAFDHILRAKMVAKLASLPTAHRLLPFVMASYGERSCYVWNDANGTAHDVFQGEGGEQGDALMPALFCLGLHEALERSQRQFLPGEKLLAYLNDIYIVTQPSRARQVYDIVTNEVRLHTGVEPNRGKTE